MTWWHYLVAIFAALVLTNGIPHLTQGIAGKPFLSPFTGGPPNDDPLPERNVLWGAANLIVGGVLLWLIRDSLGDWLIIVEMLVIAIAFAVLLARAMSGRMSFPRPAVVLQTKRPASLRAFCIPCLASLIRRHPSR